MDGNKTVTATFTEEPYVGGYEDFEGVGFVVGQTVGAHDEWFDGGGGPLVNATGGVAGSKGLSPSANIFTWTAHPFNWNTTGFQGVAFQMDFQTDASGNFDDDRIGWMITNNNCRLN